jgi:uncharacterized protein (TIGR00255 family)
MEKAVRAIEARVPHEEKRYAKRLKERIRKPASGREFSSEEKDMLLRMVGVFTEKTDIAEELSRLKGHIAQFRHCMDKEEKPGKTLNFITQEMLREANTIGSKAASLDIRKSVIRIKTLIEEVKEQSSNVE